MTITRYGGELTAECDDCGDSVTAEDAGVADNDFGEFVDALKSDGWRISQNGDTWTHTYPDCV